MTDEKRGKFSSLLAELADQIAAGYREELKMTPEEARHAADLAIEMIRAHAGGGALYIAKGHLWAITKKHRMIYRRFTGANHAVLAREFGLTERMIYSIVANVGREEFEKKQIKLFDP
jgi:Mor family transcriptional regulator